MAENKDNAAEGSVAETGVFESEKGLGILNEALDGEYAGMDFRLESVKIPSGGADVFSSPDDDDEGGAPVKEITAVIVFQHPAYSYYATKYEGGNNPPDCSSFDGEKGCGNPGGECRKCPYNQFGSGEGQAKACKNRRMLYLLREGELLPVVLNLPTGSLREFTRYVQHQIMKGRLVSQVVTRITLKKAVSGKGITFSQASFRFVRALTQEENASMSKMAEQLKVYAQNLTSEVLTPSDGQDVPFDDAEGEQARPL